MDSRFEIVDGFISWEDIPSDMSTFELFNRTLDDIPEDEQTEFLADIILNSLYGK